MTGRLSEIYRYPIKAHGAETLKAVDLQEGKCLPYDRAWAATHEASESDANGSVWVRCANFSRGAKAPELVAISSQLDEEYERITLSHPRRPDLTFNPSSETSAFVDWVRPLMPADRAATTGLVRARSQGMTDTAFPSISLNNHASRRALGQKLGQDLSPLRFRGNLWFEGLGPWEEFEWVGRTIRIGDAEFRVEERIERCLATAANPATGRRDADTLGALEEGWGHRDFGVYAIVTKSGQISLNDMVEAVA